MYLKQFFPSFQLANWFTILVWLSLQLSPNCVIANFVNQKLLLSALPVPNQTLDQPQQLDQLAKCDLNTQQLHFIRYAGVRVQSGLMDKWALHGLNSLKIRLEPNPSDESEIQDWNVQQCLDACTQDHLCHSFVFQPTQATCHFFPISTGLLMRSQLLDQGTLHKGDSHFFEKLCLSKGWNWTHLNWIDD